VSNPVGIKEVKEEIKMKEELQSPFRKRRGTLQKLKIKDDDEEDAKQERLAA